MMITEREFDLAIERIETAIEKGAKQLETVMVGFDARLREAERITTLQMWFWKVTGMIGLVVLGAWLKFK